MTRARCCLAYAMTKQHSVDCTLRRFAKDLKGIEEEPMISVHMSLTEEEYEMLRDLLYANQKQCEENSRSDDPLLAEVSCRLKERIDSLLGKVLGPSA